MVLQESGKTADAVEWYKKTLDKDPNYEGALANLGICYTALAQEYSQKNASTNIKDKAKIAKDKEIINGYFKEALPLYEKLRKLQPTKTELWITGLSNCYYNLNMDKELKEIEKYLPKE
jgi:tetratricopeptide (TPR) repeat protein